MASRCESEAGKDGLPAAWRGRPNRGDASVTPVVCLADKLRLRLSYNDIHNAIQSAAERINKEFCECYICLQGCASGSKFFVVRDTDTFLAILDFRHDTKTSHTLGLAPSPVTRMSRDYPRDRSALLYDDYVLVKPSKSLQISTISRKTQFST
jgi:hypothetical protein